MSSTITVPARVASASAGKRVNFILSARAHSDLTSLAESTHRSMTDIVRLGLGLAKIAFEASRDGYRLVVTNSEGQPIKEIVLPE